MPRTMSDRMNYSFIPAKTLPVLPHTAAKGFTRFEIIVRGQRGARQVWRENVNQFSYFIFTHSFDKEFPY